MQAPRHRTLILSTLFALLLAGCALPNLKPFADATATLHAAVVENNANVLRTYIDIGQPQQADQSAAQLAIRVAAMRAVVEYSDSLALIAAAGNSGGDSAAKVAGALDGFLGALSAPALPSNYVALAKSLYGAVASVRAARDFADAVERADPAIQGMATILAADLQDTERILMSALVPMERRLTQEISDNKQVVDYRKQLEKRRREIEKDMATPFDRSKFDELRQVNALIDMTRDRYDPLMAKVEDIRHKNVAQIMLNMKARDGVKQWAAIHAGLAISVRQGLPPNIRLLTTTATEIRDILAKENKS